MISSFSAAGYHEVRLMSPEFAQPQVKAQKNDDRDAEAIAEAATRPTIEGRRLYKVILRDVVNPEYHRSRFLSDLACTHILKFSIIGTIS
jgi:transposase